jgi:hypothetical protein
MALGAKADIDAAAALHREATLASRKIVEVVRTRIGSGSPLDHVVLVNLLSQVAHDGVSAFAFVNGAREMVELTTGVPIEYLAEPGRDLTVSVEGGERRELTFPAGQPASWQTLTLTPNEIDTAGDTAVVHIEPRGTKTVFLQALAASPNGAD